jgi:Ca2+-transporting ATPase
MKQRPRRKDEPIIDNEMRVGIVVQTIVKTSATLSAYLLGLKLFPSTEFHNLTAATMAFVTLALSELARAYTTRSEHYSVFSGGIFSNKNMNWAVLVSTALLLLVVYTPPLQGIFETTPLGWLHWEIILPLALLPALAAEITKWFLRRGLQRQAAAEASA